MASVTERIWKSCVTERTSARLNLPPLKRFRSQGARAIIQAETKRPTAKRRLTLRATDAEKS
jgi:hypothetical protein